MINFSSVSMGEKHQNWKQAVSTLETKNMAKVPSSNPFSDDIYRITTSNAFRRLGNKTQVFALQSNTHISSRLSHSMEVSSISMSICSKLGLNPILAHAGALAHDLGHSPFGHKGESIINAFIKECIDGNLFFKHAHHGLFLVDNLELSNSIDGIFRNMYLSYAVRDCIITHSGRLTESGLIPRDEATALDKLEAFVPYTWEGCVVKISDDISYLSTDLRDSARIGYDVSFATDLCKSIGLDVSKTTITEYLINDLCKNSSISEGLHFSPEAFKFIIELRKLNYNNIYESPRNAQIREFLKEVFASLFKFFERYYEKQNTLQNIMKDLHVYPKTLGIFKGYVTKYFDFEERDATILQNKILFDFNCKEDYWKCIICFIAGLTDNKVIEFYEELNQINF